ncbi:MAG TPA: hypothetical protein VMB71_11650 [Acetobacteraceae bacterium]|nr:hypothetical protein [Acetobacteraceae bacterium]
MAFAIRNLSVLAYANGFTLWHYKATPDDPSMVGAPGYFTEAGDMLAAGDMLLVSTTYGGRVLSVLGDRGTVRTTPLA